MSVEDYVHAKLLQSPQEEDSFPPQLHGCVWVNLLVVKGVAAVLPQCCQAIDLVSVG